MMLSRWGTPWIINWLEAVPGSRRREERRLSSTAEEEWLEQESWRESLETVVKQRQFAKFTITECDSLIRAIFDANDLSKVTCNNNEIQYVVYRFEGKEPSKRIDAVKLMEQGVPAHVIQAATIIGKRGKPGIGVRQVEEKDSSANEPDQDSVTAYRTV